MILKTKVGVEYHTANYLSSKETNYSVNIMITLSIVNIEKKIMQYMWFIRRTLQDEGDGNDESVCRYISDVDTSVFAQFSAILHQRWCCN